MIRLFGPEYIGGIGDVIAKVDAEVARTGLSENEIGRQVTCLVILLLDGLSDLRIQRYTTIQKENSFGFMGFL